MKKNVLIVFYISFTWQLVAQTKTFSVFHEKASAAQFSSPKKIDQNNLPNNIDDLLILLYNNKNWDPEEIKLVNQLYNQDKYLKNPFRLAILNHVASFAYVQSDLNLSDSLNYKAYNYFLKEKDIDGVIRIGASILNNAYMTTNESNISSSVDHLYQTILSYKGKAKYLPSQFYIADLWFDYRQQKGLPITESQIDSIYTKFKAFETSKPYLSFQLYAGLVVHSKDPVKRLKYAKRCLQLKTPNQTEINQIISLYNLGKAYAVNRKIDSAIYYYSIAHTRLKQNNQPHNVNINTIITKKIASAYYVKKNIDSVYKYLALHGNFKTKMYEAQLEQKRIDADKKFEMLQYKLKSQALEENILLQNKEKIIYRFIIALVLLFSIVLGFLMYKSRKLVKKTKIYAHNREQLLQVVSHDLTGAIGAMVSYVKSYERAKKLLPKEEVSALDNEFVSSAKSIQVTLKNINFWSRGLRNKLKLDKHRFHFDDFLLVIINTYQEYALTKKQTVKATHQVGYVKTIPGDLALLIRNLLSNAIKHGLENTTIKVHAWHKGNTLNVQICNSMELTDLKFLERSILAIQQKKFEVQTTLGFELINLALQRLEGEISLETNTTNKDVVCITIRIPIKR